MSQTHPPVVLVASEDAVLLDEIVRHLEEIPNWKLAGSARSVAEFVQSVDTHRPDAVLISDVLTEQLAGSGFNPGGARVVVVARSEKTSTLRAALTLGASGFVLWPEAQADLRTTVERSLGKRPQSRSTGSLLAVWSPKGGSGASVLAAHVSAGLARLGVNATLIDLDLDHSDQTAILGAETESKSFSDLLRVVDEISTGVLDTVAWKHPEGFRAVLAPGSPGELGLVKPADVLRVLAAIRDAADVVVVDMPSGYSELVPAVVDEASEVLLVVTADLLALRRARDLMRMLRSAADKFRIVLNQFSKGDVSPNDVQTVLGRPVALTVGADPGIYASPGRGVLSESGLRLVDPLVRRIAGVDPAIERSRLRRPSRRAPRGAS